MLERPRLLERLTRHRAERLPGSLHATIELRQQGLRSLEAVAASLGEIDERLVERPGNPARHQGYELGKMSQREGFLVRLPLTPFAGDALEEPSGGSHFLIGFREGYRAGSEERR